jgi:DNA-binding Lrp family transcriptional regulator
MAVRAYVLVQTAPGRAKESLNLIKDLKLREARLLAADAVTGPYDLVATLEAEDLNALGTAVAEGIQNAEGVTRTTTCIAVEIL